MPPHADGRIVTATTADLHGHDRIPPRVIADPQHCGGRCLLPPGASWNLQAFCGRFVIADADR
jgi:hypothetical protein